MIPTEHLPLWRNDPVQFVRDHFDLDPEPWQADALMAIATGRRVAMKACKGPGKTAVLAWMIWWFLATRPYAKVVATSISQDNLDDCLWAELAKWMQGSPMLRRAFRWTKTRIVNRSSPDTWFASARAWSRQADAAQQADTLAGLHADSLLFVLDEAGGIPEAVMAAAEASLATGGDTKIAMAGNPTDLGGSLHRACVRDRALWRVIDITADPDDPKRSRRVSAQWAREQISRYGRDNPWVLVNVFGKFPPAGSNALLGSEDVATATGRVIRPEHLRGYARVIGIDVALYGDDRTVLFPRQGPAAMRPVILRKTSGAEVAARAARAYQQWNADAVMIDSTGGWAGPIPHILRECGVTVFEINFSGAPIDPRYYNKRSEMWNELAEWVKTRGALPDIAELTRELSEPTYAYQDGRLRLEEKAQLKTRLGFSPDLGDALALTFAMPVMAKRQDGQNPSHYHGPTALDMELEEREPWMSRALLPGRRRRDLLDEEP